MEKFSSSKSLINVVRSNVEEKPLKFEDDSLEECQDDSKATTMPSRSKKEENKCF